MKKVELVEFQSFNNCWWWGFEESKTVEWGILNRAKFYVPNGYHIGTDGADTRHIYEDKTGWQCDLETSYKNGDEGEVFIIDHSKRGKKIKLERVTDKEE